MSNANSLQFPAYNEDGCDFDHLQHLLLAYDIIWHVGNLLYVAARKSLVALYA